MKVYMCVPLSPLRVGHHLGLGSREGVWQLFWVILTGLQLACHYSFWKDIGLIAAILARFPFYNTFIHTPPKSLFSKGRGTLWEPDPAVTRDLGIKTPPRRVPPEPRAGHFHLLRCSHFGVLVFGITECEVVRE